MILSYALLFALLCFGAALVMNLLRLFTAPTLTDRLLAVDTMTVNAIALIVLYGVRTGSASNAWAQAASGVPCRTAVSVKNTRSGSTGSCTSTRPT